MNQKKMVAGTYSVMKDFRTFGEAMMRKLVNEVADARPRLSAIGEATAAADFLQLWMDFFVRNRAADGHRAASRP